MVKLSSGSFIKSDEIKKGDKITILDEGEFVKSNRFFLTDKNNQPVLDEDGNQIPKTNFEIRIRLPEDKDSKEGKISMNKTSRDLICQVFGEETSGWVGKEVVAYITITPNKKRMIIFYVNHSQLVEMGIEDE